MDAESHGDDTKMSKRASLKSKKALIVLPYLKNGDGTAVAIMNYYQSLIDDGWHVDFMHLKSNACQWLNEVRENMAMFLNCLRQINTPLRYKTGLKMLFLREIMIWFM